MVVQVFDKLKDMKASKNSTEVAENLSILEHISRSSGSEAALQRNTGASNGKPSNVSKHAGSSTNVGSLSHAVSLPQIGTSPAVNTTAANAVHSARQHINNSASAAASSALHPPRSHTQPEAITFRVRGGPNAGTVTPSAGGGGGGGGGKVMVSAVDVNSSLRSSGGGWMINSEDEEQEEERLKQELKAAKVSQLVSYDDSMLIVCWESEKSKEGAEVEGVATTEGGASHAGGQTVGKLFRPLLVSLLINNIGLSA